MADKDKSLRKIVIDEDSLNGRTLDVNNLALELNCSEEERIVHAIEAYVRSEQNTFRYAAASFAPILLLLSTLQFYDQIDDTYTNILITIIVIMLGVSGFYFAVYNSILLTFRRILLEGLQLKLIQKIDWDIFPQGGWRVLNFVAMFCLLLGYLGIFLLLLRRLWN